MPAGVSALPAGCAPPPEVSRPHWALGLPVPGPTGAGSCRCCVRSVLRSGCVPISAGPVRRSGTRSGSRELLRGPLYASRRWTDSHRPRALPAVERGVGVPGCSVAGPPASVVPTCLGVLPAPPSSYLRASEWGSMDTPIGVRAATLRCSGQNRERNRWCRLRSCSHRSQGRVCASATNRSQSLKGRFAFCAWAQSRCSCVLRA